MGIGIPLYMHWMFGLQQCKLSGSRWHDQCSILEHQLAHYLPGFVDTKRRSAVVLFGQNDQEVVLENTVCRRKSSNNYQVALAKICRAPSLFVKSALDSELDHVMTRLTLLKYLKS